MTDRIVIRCECPGELKKALEKFREYVSTETLALDLLYSLPEDGSSEQVEVEGMTVKISVERRV